MKINVFTLLSDFFDSVDNEPFLVKYDKSTIENIMLKIKEILSNNFEVQLSKIYEEITHNGFDKNEFIKQFKIENKVSLFDFRQVKKLEYALNLLKEGDQIKEITKKLVSKVTINLSNILKKNAARHL